MTFNGQSHCRSSAHHNMLPGSSYKGPASLEKASSKMNTLRQQRYGYVTSTLQVVPAAVLWLLYWQHADHGSSAMAASLPP
jgi:hypothetical protein